MIVGFFVLVFEVENIDWQEYVGEKWIVLRVLV